mmetsp:Transcript_90670/g.173981  ORF Transcript_90670/g.173981 Transcript_90670/m.173981 type:complete len:351 (-) Transcript_90670:88-1140(-)
MVTIGSPEESFDHTNLLGPFVAEFTSIGKDDVHTQQRFCCRDVHTKKRWQIAAMAAAKWCCSCLDPSDSSNSQNVFEICGLGFWITSIALMAKEPTALPHARTVGFCLLGVAVILSFCALYRMDGEIFRWLSSREKNSTGDDDYVRVPALLEELRNTPPHITFEGKAWLEQQNAQGTWERTYTAEPSEAMSYAAWRDVSKAFPDLENSKWHWVNLSIQVEVKAADEATAQLMKSIAKRVWAVVKDREKTSGRMLVELKDCVHTAPQIYRCYGSSGRVPCWMSTILYAICCFLCLGTLYKTLFDMTVADITYYIRKEVSISENFPIVGYEEGDRRSFKAATLQSIRLLGKE